jgi:hypothetical protein
MRYITHGEQLLPHQELLLLLWKLLPQFKFKHRSCVAVAVQ